MGSQDATHEEMGGNHDLRVTEALRLWGRESRIIVLRRDWTTSGRPMRITLPTLLGSVSLRSLCGLRLKG
jgi:hypothetical protein